MKNKTTIHLPPMNPCRGTVPIVAGLVFMLTAEQIGSEPVRPRSDLRFRNNKMSVATHVSLNRVLQVVVRDRQGFLTKNDLEVIAAQDRHRLILVRCGCGRFLCPADNVQHFMNIIARDGQDYVRDISLPTSDAIWKQS